MTPESAATGHAPGQILVLTPVEGDADAVRHVLRQEGLAATSCENVASLIRFLGPGAGVIIIAEEALGASADARLLCDALTTQPEWSDIPILLLASRGTEAQGASNLARGLHPVANVTILERPLARATLLNAVRVAMRARNRQYQAREMIDRRAQDAAALAETEKQFRMFFELGVSGAAQAEPLTGRLLIVNDRYCQIVGRSREQLLNTTFHEITHPDDRGQNRDEYLRMVRGEIPQYESEKRCIRPDGSVVWVHAAARVVRDAAGNPIWTVALVQDISERKHMQESAQRLAAIVRSSDDAIISKDLSGIVTSWNQGAERIFGYSAQEMIGRPVAVLIPPDRAAEEPAILERLKRGESVEHFQTVRQHRDGRRLDISVTISAIFDEHGRVIGASKVARNITHLKAVEEELQRHRAQLETMVRQRTDELEASQLALRQTERMAALGNLSAGLGHDMGNLILPIRMRLDSMLSEPLSDKLREDMRAIEASVTYLQRLSNSLKLLAVDPTRTAAPRVTSLLDWWIELLPLLKAALPREARLVEPPDSDLALASVAMAPEALSQMVLNLVQNAGEAIAQSGRPGGEVRIAISAPPNAARVKISVSDNGPGMTPEVQRRCMEPFFSTKGRRISTGLGLSLVKGLIERAHGTLRVTSVEGQGTEFLLEIPAGRERPSKRGPVARDRRTIAVSVPDPRARILVLHAINRIGAEGRQRDDSDPGDSDAWIVQSREGVIEVARRFIAESPEGRPRKVLILGQAPPEPLNASTSHDPFIMHAEPGLHLALIQSKVAELLDPS